MARTDVHSPKHLITEDYEFFGCGAFPTASTPGHSPLIGARGQALLNDGWHFADVETSGCQHCGAFIVYYAILLHKPTKTFLRVGETCLDNRFERSSADFHRLRKQAQLDREQQRIKARREEWLAASPDNATALDYASNVHGYDEFLNKFVGYVSRHGEASEKWVAAILRNKERDEKRAQERAEEQANSNPVIEGRGSITGRILTMKYQDGIYGTTCKMLVADDRGFKLWGTCPVAVEEELASRVSASEHPNVRALLKAEEVRVSLVGKVERSKDDEFFGFYSRPSKAGIQA